MTIKYVPSIKSSEESDRSRLSAFSLPEGGSGFSPVAIPLVFHYLRPNTRYRIFIKNNEEVVGSRQEDITAFCTPFGESIEQNNNAKVFSDLISTPSGDLFINVKPFGTDGLDITTKNWADYWKFFSQSSFSLDSNRNNFIAVEASKTIGAVGDKQKTIRGELPASTSLPLLNKKDGDNYIKQNFKAKFVQTFFIDPNATSFSKTVDLTDITLYFRNQPERTNNTSGIRDPGVVVALIDVEDRTPIVNRQYKNSIVRKTWSEITPSTDASVATIFSFKDSVRLEVGKVYGIAISFDDPEYTLWSSVSGDVLVGTNDISSGNGKGHRGNLYQLTNSADKIDNTNFELLYTEKTSADLKFDVHAAEYKVDEEIDIDLVNNDYEFLNISGSNNFHGGEKVYQLGSAETGSVSANAGQREIRGSGTAFTNLTIGERIVLIDTLDANKTEVVIVSTIINDERIATQDPVIFTRAGDTYQRPVTGIVQFYDFANRRLILSSSNAGAATGTLPKKQFVANNTIIGVESGAIATVEKVDALPLSVFATNLELDLPSNFSVKGKYNNAKRDNAGFQIDVSDKEVNFFRPNYNTDYQGFVLSKSTEIDTANTMFDAGTRELATANTQLSITVPKSAQYRLRFKNETPAVRSFESPELAVRNATSSTSLWLINNDATDEHTNDGAAVSKYISKKLTFKQGQAAEDIRVICNAYRPIGTDFKVYAKILNEADPEAFDDKLWTELTITRGENQFGDPDNLFDFREYEFGFPSTIPSVSTLTGTVTAQTGNVSVTGSGTTFTTDLQEGEIIKIYDPLFPEQFEIFGIDTIVSDTSLTLTEPVTNINIGGGDSVRVDKVFPQNIGFNNPNNFNIVRYFDSTGAHYDTYSTVAVKIVLLSDNAYVVPRVDDYRVIGVSA